MADHLYVPVIHTVASNQHSCLMSSQSNELIEGILGRKKGAGNLPHYFFTQTNPFLSYTFSMSMAQSVRFN